MIKAKHIDHKPLSMPDELLYLPRELPGTTYTPVIPVRSVAKQQVIR